MAKTKGILTAKERVEKEKEEVTQKAEKLQTFIASEKFKALPYAQRRLLSEQFNIMCSYIDCLAARLSIWTEI